MRAPSLTGIDPKIRAENKRLANKENPNNDSRDHDSPVVTPKPAAHVADQLLEESEEREFDQEGGGPRNSKEYVPVEGLGKHLVCLQFAELEIDEGFSLESSSEIYAVKEVICQGRGGGEEDECTKQEVVVKCKFTARDIAYHTSGDD